jgi:hypothetical protein
MQAAIASLIALAAVLMKLVQQRQEAIKVL